MISAWLVAGTLDIADAAVYTVVRGGSPVRMLRGIAFALVGPAARTGGAWAPWLGLAIHFAIALVWTAVFFVLARPISALRRHAVLSGAMYGLIVYAVMNFVVLPMTHIGRGPLPHGFGLINGVLALVLLLGIPVALFARRAERSAFDT